MLFYEPRKRDHGLPHDPFKAIVAPRPIGWITAMSTKGETNLSPYSFFNAVSDNPHMVAFASDGRKDAITFIEETKEFVCSIASVELREAMNVTSAPLPRGENEMAFAGLEPAPSRLVRPPRVAKAPAALECRWLQTVPLTALDGTTRYFLVIGEVVGIHVDERLIRDGQLDTLAMGPIARGGYFDYFALGERFEIRRPAGGGGGT